MTTMQLRETPLAALHQKIGARMVDFAGWYMPVQYKSIVAEHMAVRTKVGIFDVSHMGEFIITGKDAHDFVQYVIANDVSKLSQPDMALYTQFVRPDGGTVDDLIVYKRANDFLLVVNASNISKDWDWLKQQSSQFDDIVLKDASDDFGLLALQGPKAAVILDAVTGGKAGGLASFTYGEATVDGVKIGFGRTGYTGEDGFEIFIPSHQAEKIWNLLMEKGQGYGIEPCGLGARDTLRLEAGLPLYGHELTDEISPLESGLGWSVKLEKGDFLGKEALIKQKEKGLLRQIVCLKSEGKLLPRQGYKVFDGNKEIGEITSGSQGIFVGYPIAFAVVPSAYSVIGQQVSIAIRDNKVMASVVKRPFYKRKA